MRVVAPALGIRVQNPLNSGGWPYECPPRKRGGRLLRTQSSRSMDWRLLWSQKLGPRAIIYNVHSCISVDELMQEIHERFAKEVLVYQSGWTLKRSVMSCWRELSECMSSLLATGLDHMACSPRSSGAWVLITGPPTAKRKSCVCSLLVECPYGLLFQQRGVLPELRVPGTSGRAYAQVDVVPDLCRKGG